VLERDLLRRLRRGELGVPHVSEIFPVEMRAIAISLFYGRRHGARRLRGPPLYGAIIESGQPRRALRRV